ncbi:cytochrome P450 [Serendipita vermifera]|nr:cytochrome P450 [Serendipita vermifera]
MDRIPPIVLESPIKTCTTSLLAILFGYFTVKGLRKLLERRENHPYPPGPPREFLLGTMRSYPKGFPLERFNEWARIYGDIVYAPMPGRSVVILSSHEIAQELLSKRPSSTSGRRSGNRLSNLMGWQWEMPLQQPGFHHSNQRKMLRRAIGPQRVGSHDPRIEYEISKLLIALNTFQGTPLDVLQECIGRMVSKVVYRELIWKEMGHELSHWNTEALDILQEAGFSVFLVDVFPFLRFIPDWVPGLRFKYLIREGQRLSHKVRHLAYRRSVELFKSGSLGHCILSDLLEEFGEGDDTQDATSVLYLAASDTTSGAALMFLHALFLFPDIAERVYAEIHSVTQGVRLPQITDRAQLPYTVAVWKEVIRWRTFFPIGVAHLNLEDEIIKGYFLPKGTFIQQNTRMMLNDPKAWGDPEVFRPERFLEPNAAQRPNPLTTLFGWGMRVCPGMYFADRMVFHLAATVISLYKVEPLEGNGIPDPDNIKYTPKMLHLPIGFELSPDRTNPRIMSKKFYGGTFI